MNINFLPLVVPPGSLDHTQLPHEQSGKTQSPVLGDFLCEAVNGLDLLAFPAGMFPGCKAAVASDSSFSVIR